MRHEDVIVVIGIIGFVLQFMGICKAISSVKGLRELFDDWCSKWGALGHGQNTGMTPGTSAMEIEAPTPRVSSGLSGSPPPDATLEQLSKWAGENLRGVVEQIAALDVRLDKLGEEKTREIHNEQSQRAEGVKEMRKDYEDYVAKADNAAAFLLFGTLFLLIAELGKWCFDR